jgi:hypothetical protein
LLFRSTEGDPAVAFPLGEIGAAVGWMPLFDVSDVTVGCGPTGTWTPGFGVVGDWDPVGTTGDGALCTGGAGGLTLVGEAGEATLDGGAFVGECGGAFVGEVGGAFVGEVGLGACVPPGVIGDGVLGLLTGALEMLPLPAGPVGASKAPLLEPPGAVYLLLRSAGWLPGVAPPPGAIGVPPAWAPPV